MAIGNPYKQYQKNSVTTATPEELTLMLYNGAIKFTKLARINMENKNIAETSNNLIKTQDIISELDTSLNLDYDVSQELSNLYAFIRERLIDANIEKDIAILDEITPLMEDMRDTWKEAMEIAKQERINPQPVEAY